MKGPEPKSRERIVLPFHVKTGVKPGQPRFSHETPPSTERRSASPKSPEPVTKTVDDESGKTPTPANDEVGVALQQLRPARRPVGRLEEPVVGHRVHVPGSSAETSLNDSANESGRNAVMPTTKPATMATATTERTMRRRVRFLREAPVMLGTPATVTSVS